jgi:hypothetical protein
MKYRIKSFRMFESDDSLIQAFPGRYAYHTSNPIFRDSISREGLVPKGKSEAWLSDTKIGGKAIFAVDSERQEAAWDSGYDDDIWRIDTSGLSNIWHYDPNFGEGSDRIVTFEPIPRDSIDLVYSGTGKAYESLGILESVDPAIAEKACSLYEDVRSIGHVLEEEGFYPEYRICVVCVPDGTLQKEIRTIRVDDSDNIRRFLGRSSFMEMRSFVVKIDNSNPKRLDRNDSLDFFREEVDRYLAILKEHLDYVPEEHIKKQLWHSVGEYYDISISSDFFAL